jgi:hypothetical protein
MDGNTYMAAQDSEAIIRITRAEEGIVFRGIKSMDIATKEPLSFFVLESPPLLICTTTEKNCEEKSHQ